MKNYVQAGETLTLTASAAITSGQLVVAGAIVGFAQTDAEAGDLVSLVTEGVYAADVLSAANIAVGDVIYATAAGALTTTEAGNVRAGVAWSSGSSNGTAATVNVKLNA